MGSHKEFQNVAVVMVPMPAQGHLNQLLHLSHRLASAANLTVFYLGTMIYDHRFHHQTTTIPPWIDIRVNYNEFGILIEYTPKRVNHTTTHIRQAKLRLDGCDPQAISNINFHDFPTPCFQTSTTSLRNPVFAFVNDLSSKYKGVVVIYDTLMAYLVQDIHSLSKVALYRFWSVSVISMCYFRWNAARRPDDLPGEALSILYEIPGMDGHFPPEFRSVDRASEKNVSGTIYNSSKVIEGLYLDLLANGDKKQWALGPFNPVTANYPEEKIYYSRTSRHECLDWLDKQDLNSVIFVSFGTTSCISDEQNKEVAIGLEKSKHRFIWVLRDADKGDIFTGEVRKMVLPDGFEERVKERGVVIRERAPQLDILSHFATGGFMSHCGWNSCMESISMGVPIATWPMHSEQPINAVLVTKGLRIGVEVKDWECRDAVVRSGAVESAVRKLMSSEGGEEMRKRAKELGVRFKSSVMEGGGISSKEMDSFIAHITVKSKL